MTSNARAAAVLILAATAASAMGRRPPTEKTAMISQEWKGQSGGPAQAGSEVSSDAESWRRLWSRLGSDAPPLDFSKFVAVAAYVGEKPTGGYSPAFDEPAAKGDDLIVRYRVPKPAGFSSQAFTKAWKVRVFPRPKGRVLVEAASE
jgi:hypothetical protein